MDVNGGQREEAAGVVQQAGRSMASADARATGAGTVPREPDTEVGQRYAPSQQNLVWGIVFGVLMLALALAAM